MNITLLGVIISLVSLFMSLFALVSLYLNNKKVQENYLIFKDISKELIVKNKVDNDIKEISLRNLPETNNSKNKLSELNSTQIEIIKLANTSEITARDVMQKFNITREHASRLLSHLAIEGYLKRISESKPYKYTIGEKGREYLSGQI